MPGGRGLGCGAPWGAGLGGVNTFPEGFQSEVPTAVAGAVRIAYPRRLGRGGGQGVPRRPRGAESAAGTMRSGGGERGWSLLPPAAGRAGQMDTEELLKGCGGAEEQWRLDGAWGSEERRRRCRGGRGRRGGGRDGCYERARQRMTRGARGYQAAPGGCGEGREDEG